MVLSMEPRLMEMPRVPRKVKPSSKYIFLKDMPKATEEVRGMGGALSHSLGFEVKSSAQMMVVNSKVYAMLTERM